MAININIPSQVKNYANLAAFPASGSLKTIYIAEDTNKTYRWTGSVYVEISATAASTWGAITGTLSSQTDLNTALSGKQATVTLTTTGTSGASTFVANTLNVPTYSLSGLGGVPTSRTLTINGTTQDLSADRTFTIATGLTVGTTPIASGTVGRVLFQGTGNVLQQSGNLFWDDTNLRLGINGTPTSPLEIFYNPTGISNTIGLTLNSGSTGSTLKAIRFTAGTFGELGTFGVNTGSGEFRWATSASYFPTIYSNGAERLRIATTGNVLINTTTDAGFKLDVNGTARVQNTLTVSAGGAVITGQVQANGGLKTTVVLNNTFNTNSNSKTIFQSSDALGEARFYQSVCAGYVATINTSAVLQAESTTQGFLPPRMTTTQRNAIASPAAGLVVYDNTLNKLCVRTASAWETITSV
jgi:hypothetical protein